MPRKVKPSKAAPKNAGKDGEVTLNVTELVEVGRKGLPMLVKVGMWLGGTLFAGLLAAVGYGETKKDFKQDVKQEVQQAVRDVAPEPKVVQQSADAMQEMNANIKKMAENQAEASKDIAVIKVTLTTSAAAQDQRNNAQDAKIEKFEATLEKALEKVNEAAAAKERIRILEEWKANAERRIAELEAGKGK